MEIVQKSSRKSLDPASQNRLQKSEERFGCEEMVPDICDVPKKKRHCVGTSEIGERGSEFDACIVCEVSDMLVMRCSGIDCLVSFHGECLTPEYGGSDDLANPFCPYCWYKFVVLKSKSLRDEAIVAEKAVVKYVDKDMISKDQELQVKEDSGKPNMVLTEETDQREEGNGKSDEVDASGEQERVATGTFQGAEDDDETPEVQAKVKSCAVVLYAGKEHDQVQQSEKQRIIRNLSEISVVKYVDKDMKSKDQELQGEKASEKSIMPITEETEQPEEGIGKSGDTKEDEVEALEDQERINIENFQDAEDDEKTAKVKSDAVVLYSGKEHNQVKQNEKQRRRRRRVVLNDDTDSEISSTKERIGEDVTEQITSENTNNQQRKLSKATSKEAAANSETPRGVLFFSKDQRRRLLWTSKEEEMLQAGVVKFAAEANKNMPWRKILKMGENVFHQSRTSADLKDKWRNMIKSLH